MSHPGVGNSRALGSGQLLQSFYADVYFKGKEIFQLIFCWLKEVTHDHIIWLLKLLYFTWSTGYVNILQFLKLSIG
jgi:hypothetical protein